MTIVLAGLFVVAAIVAASFYMQVEKLKQALAAASSASAAAPAPRSASARPTRAEAPSPVVPGRELEQLREEVVRRKAEAADLRGKLNELKSKHHRQAQEEQRQRALIEGQTAPDLERARRRLEEEQARVEALEASAQTMKAELAAAQQSRQAAEKAQAHFQTQVQRLEQALASVQSAVPAEARVVVSKPAAPAPVTDEALVAKAAQAEKLARDARRQAEDAQKELSNVRGKLSAQTRQALTAQNDLELFRSKLVWSEKRVVDLEKILFDAQLPIPARDPAPSGPGRRLAPGLAARLAAATADAPGATGEGEVAVAVDYVPEATIETAPSHASSPVTGSEESIADGVVIEAAVPETTESVETTAASAPEGVIRRPRAEVEAREQKDESAA